MPELWTANMGIERETQRINTKGQLATTKHPAAFGNRSFHPYIQTDFSETQLELVTPKMHQNETLLNWLKGIHQVTWRTLPATELLWPLSMPPKLPLDEQEIVIAKLQSAKDIAYRQHIGKVYGRRKQMISGIHFNFEFSPKLVEMLFQGQTEQSNFDHFKAELYFKVARNYLRYQWLITYLFGASPSSEANFFIEETGPKQPVCCIRTCRFGYTNHEDVQVSYQDIERYLADLDDLVATGKLSAKKEFYAPVRLRGGKAVADLTKSDIQYMELRNIDINPFEAVGISEAQISFLKLFLLYMLWTEETEPADQWVATGKWLNNQVALEHPLTTTSQQSEGLMLIGAIKEMVTRLALPSKMQHLCELAQDLLQNPQQTLAGRLYQVSRKTSQGQFALEQALKNGHVFRGNCKLDGFEKLTLNRQQQLFTAIQKGESLLAMELANKDSSNLKRVN